MDLIKKARNNDKGNFKVHKLERSEVLNIEALRFPTKKGEKLVQVKPTKGKKFQTASVIVMKASCPDGYILKQNFEERDEQGTYIDVAIEAPEGQEQIPLDLGKVTLEPKYPSELKLAQDKLEHLNTMRSSLYAEGIWIDQLLQRQRQLDGDVIEEGDCDESEQLFPLVMETTVAKKRDPTNMESQSNS